MPKEKATPEGTAFTFNPNPSCEKLTTKQIDTQCKCANCTCGNTVVNPPHIVGYWPHHLAPETRLSSMKPELVELLNQRRDELSQYKQEYREISTVDMIDFILQEDEYIREEEAHGE